MPYQTPPGGELVAMLGPTNTGKTHRAVERMLEHQTGCIGLPLRLLAREIYDRVSARIGERAVALVTGEEKRVPPSPRYWVCTVESMPIDRDVDFVAVDEIQLAAHAQRGHTFTDRLLRARGRLETWFLGAESMRHTIEMLVPTARIETHPRLSHLAHVGGTTIGALPQRTAVVAFSVDSVYDLAQRIRRRHGGTAVVLGALSPRTRNAQVAMYQSGEVHYMVATDAIGMGLNMDVDRVAFAESQKFDGHELRPLDDAEIGQIAGRAGRHLRNGEFGTLRPAPECAPRTVAAVENHRFPAVSQLVWRNSDLDFRSAEKLIASLRVRPPHAALRLVAQADDYDALVQMARRDEVQRRANSPEAVELLWQVCRIPDFRKLALDSHVELLEAIFLQVSGPAGAIEPQWLATRMSRLEGTDGDIATLMHRIAFIRTMTYISNQERWLGDAGHWQEVARKLEDACSDALHQRLTERFVERQATTARVSKVARSRGRGAAAPQTGPERVATGPFAQLVELFDAAPDGSFDSPDGADWVERIVEAEHDDLVLGDRSTIALDGRAIAVLGRGVDVLHPELRLVDSEGLGGGARSRVQRRLLAWVKDALGELLAPMRAVDTGQLGPAGRGVLYALEQGLGTLDGAASGLARLEVGECRAFADAGIYVRHELAYAAAGLRPAMLALRAALSGAYYGSLPRSNGGIAVSVAIDERVEPSVYPGLGYLVRGPRAIRADVLERVHSDISANPELVTHGFADLCARLELPPAELPKVLRAMGVRRGR